MESHRAALAMIASIRQVVTNKLRRRLGALNKECGIPPALARHLACKSSISVIDVGAHAGEFTRRLDLFRHIDRGLLIEPQPNRAKELASKFPPPRFEVAAMAVSDHPSVIDLEINGFDPTTSILKTKRDLPQLAGIDVAIREIVRCPVATLDSLVSSERLPQIDLLKLDVQGAERLVVRGAHETLKRTQMVWTEVSFVALYDGACLFHEIHADLNALGFQLAELEAGFRSLQGELVQADALFLKH